MLVETKGSEIMTYLNISGSDLASLGAVWTAREIQQQPNSWQNTQDILNQNAEKIEDFLLPLLELEDLRIILTGAGTSAFIGECLQPILMRKLNRRVEAIATTDLVSGPHEYFQRDVPTLVVSFGRSGSSPESVAAIELSEQMVDRCYQLVVTCNNQGELLSRCAERDNSLALLLPEETHDRSFAMTSSFTSMMYAALVALSGISDYDKKIDLLGASSAIALTKYNDSLRALAEKKFQRVIYLGSNCMTGLAREASLKLLELSDGQTQTIFDSPMGFRHGPKTAINDQTLVFVFMSNDPYTRKYDLDLLQELRSDGEVGHVVAITAQADDQVSEGDYFVIDSLKDEEDALLLFPFSIFFQVFAFHYSLILGNTPDSPSASGTVNRVVQGVTIHAFEESLIRSV